MTNDELKMQYEELYNLMAMSKNPKYMEHFGHVMTEMMDWMIANKKELAEEFINKLESIRWENYLTETEAKTIVMGMIPKAPWSYEIWEKTLAKYVIPLEDHYEYNKYSLWAVMNSIYSDSIDTIAMIAGVDKSELSEEKTVQSVYKLACDKLLDEDNVFNVRKYFGV